MDEVLAEGRFLRFGRRGCWEYVQRTGACGVVAVVAVTADHRIVLIEQHRVPLDAAVIELPAGLAERGASGAREDLAAAARRELFEETGYRAGALERLFGGPSSAGLTDEIVEFFLARDVVQEGSGGGDSSEAITVHAVPLDGAGRWLAERIRAGQLIDPKVFAGLQLARC